MLENSQIANAQSSEDGADQRNLVSIEGMNFTVGVQRSQIEIPGMAPDKTYDAMCKAIRTSGWWLVAWTVISVFQPNLPWAVVLITIALMSFYFHNVAAMFIVYSVMMFWASATNLLSGEPEWIFAAVLQVVFGIFSLREYRIYRNAKADFVSKSLSQGSSILAFTDREAHMTWLAFILGVIGLVGLCSIIPASLVLYYRPGETLEQVVTNVLGAIWGLSVLGIPVGIAALSMSRRAWGAAVLGIAMGTVMLLVMMIGLLTAGAV
ncbi:MAG TPA: hypothetical protein VK206_25010 [Anaerolineales bacterium]|nr:hypothetical protein [Anaerolineales bacterium]